MNTKQTLGAIALVAASFHAQANLILNGSFESNSAAGTEFNMNNAEFNATVSAATAFGSAQEIDLVTGNSFGIAPQSGAWKLGLHTQSTLLHDAFAFHLSAPVTAGQTYLLAFEGAALAGLASAVDIGVSGDATSFGVLIASFVPTSSDAWTEFTHSFTALSGGGFLTVRTSIAPNVYAFVDDFSLVAASVPVPATLSLLGLALAVMGWGQRRRS